MVRLFVSSLGLHSTGMSTWVDSACAPSYLTDAVRSATGERIAPQFGDGNGQSNGQSYARGVRRLR